MNRQDYTDEVWQTAFSVVRDLGVNYPDDTDIKRRLLDTIHETIADVRNTDIISLDRYIDYVLDNETHDYVIYNWEIVRSFFNYGLWGTDYEDHHRGQFDNMMGDMMAMVNDFYSDVVTGTARLVWDDIKGEEE